MTLTSTNVLLILKILCHFHLFWKYAVFKKKKKVYLLGLSSRENTLKETVGALTNVCVWYVLYSGNLSQVIVLGHGYGVVKEQLYV